MIKSIKKASSRPIKEASSSEDYQIMRRQLTSVEQIIETCSDLSDRINSLDWDYIPVDTSSINSLESRLKESIAHLVDVCDELDNQILVP